MSRPEGKYCEYHESTIHNTSKCTVLKKLKASKKEKSKTWDKKSADAKKFTQKELNNLVKKASDKVYKKGKKDSSPTKYKKDNLDDDKFEASLNNIKAIKSQMGNVDKQLSQFSFQGKGGQDKINLEDSKVTRLKNKQELLVTSIEIGYNSLDQCIDHAQLQSNDLFSLVNLVQGQPPRKKTKLKDFKPIIFGQLNS